MIIQYYCLYIKSNNKLFYLSFNFEYIIQSFNNSNNIDIYIQTLFDIILENLQTIYEYFHIIFLLSKK